MAELNTQYREPDWLRDDTMGGVVQGFKAALMARDQIKQEREMDLRAVHLTQENRMRDLKIKQTLVDRERMLKAEEALLNVNTRMSDLFSAGKIDEAISFGLSEAVRQPLLNNSPEFNSTMEHAMKALQFKQIKERYDEDRRAREDIARETLASREDIARETLASRETTAAMIAKDRRVGGVQSAGVEGAQLAELDARAGKVYDIQSDPEAHPEDLFMANESLRRAESAFGARKLSTLSPEELVRFKALTGAAVKETNPAKAAALANEARMMLPEELRGPMIEPPPEETELVKYRKQLLELKARGVKKVEFNKADNAYTETGSWASNIPIEQAIANVESAIGSKPKAQSQPRLILKASDIK